MNNLPDNAVCLDIRSEKEFKNGHLPLAINIPLNTLRERLSELDKSKTLYVNCYSGLRSYIACRILSQNGFDCYNFSGGYHFYETITSAKSVFENVYPCGIKKNTSVLNQ
ncbi:MAG: rhodanese-like domain-containing protein [Candidatus Avigastranaerophilus sp.]